MTAPRRALDLPVEVARESRALDRCAAGGGAARPTAAAVTAGGGGSTQGSSGGGGASGRRYYATSAVAKKDRGEAVQEDPARRCHARACGSREEGAQNQKNNLIANHTELG